MIGRWNVPDPMAPFDWIKRGDEFLWDDRVMDQASAEELLRLSEINSKSKYYMKRSSIVFLAIFVTTVVIVIVFFSIRQNKLEKEMGINFQVERVEVTPALRVSLYDKNGNKLRLQRFVFFERHGIQPNDIIVKKKGSKVLEVYRVDSLGNKHIHLSMNLN